MEDVTSTNPTLPFIVASIGGNEYKLCFTFGAMRRAERAIAKLFPDVNLLAAKWEDLTPTTLTALFIAGLREYQPELSATDALALLDFCMEGENDPLYIPGLINETYRAWIRTLVPKAVADPQQITEEQTT